MLADQPDPIAWTDGLSDADRRQLAPRLLTQLLLGEPVEVVDEDGDWVKVVAPWQPSSLNSQGYPGWVRRAHVAAAPAIASHDVVVTARTATLYDDADLIGVTGEASYATLLPLVEQADTAVGVHLPGARIGWLDASACLVRTTPAHRDPTTVTRDDLLTEARRFTDLGYLWGGTSAFGLDCSGLVHITYRRLGGIVPRDAHDQASAAFRLPRPEAQPGDLYFFQRDGKSIHHVAIALDEPNHVLHAANFKAVVSEVLNDERRATLLPDAGRFAIG